MPFLELLQLGITNTADKVWSLVIGTAPAVAVYAITKRDVRVAKDQVSTAREEAKKEFAAALVPALAAFKHELREDLLDSIEGTYLRNDVALTQFQTVRNDIARLERLVIRSST